MRVPRRSSRTSSTATRCRSGWASRPSSILAPAAYRMKVNDDWTARGEFVEIDSPNRVVFTWGWEREGAMVPPGSTTVEITLELDGDATLVRLVHRDLPEDSRGPHAHGWETYL